MMRNKMMPRLQHLIACFLFPFSMLLLQCGYLSGISRGLFAFDKLASAGYHEREVPGYVIFYSDELVTAEPHKKAVRYGP